ncbi:MAG: hypothetical protein ACKOQU_09400, partial [Acidimicrobiaceae bacterium]
GWAFTHGALPTTSGAPASASARNESFAATSRASESVSNKEIGREATFWSMPKSWQTARVDYGF